MNEDTIMGLQAEVKRLKSVVRDAFESGYDYGATNQIDEDSAWEAYNKEVLEGE